MNTKRMMITVMMVSASVAVWAAPPIKVKITKIPSTEGKVVVALFKDPDTFLKDDFWSQSYDIPESKMLEVEIPDIAPGAYAISIFQDENESGEIDRNFIGIPKEPYGFSNNPKLSFGPPKFADSKFDHSNEGASLEIEFYD
jgi:uncharacterized protein (DUF2141 family)